jgi:hypothetical protein
MQGKNYKHDHYNNSDDDGFFSSFFYWVDNFTQKENVYSIWILCDCIPTYSGVLLL